MHALARTLLSVTVTLSVIGGQLTAPTPAAALSLPIPNPNVIHVDTLAYVDDGADGVCSLREALQSAFNADGNPYHECAKAVADQPTLVDFTVPGVISLPDQLPFIRNHVYMLGPVILDGNNLPSPVINIVSTGILTLTNITLKNAGYSYIRNLGGMLYVAGANFEGNASGGGGGAAILNEGGGSAFIAGTNFFNNHAAPGTSGGAIISTGGTTLKVAGSAFTGNSADLSGGAIAFSGAILDIGDSAFTGNTTNGGAFAGGGAVDIGSNGSNQEPITVTRSAFTGNATGSGWGGAIFSHAPTTVTVKDSSFQANIGAGVNVSGTGGAIGNTSLLVVQRSTFFANEVTGDGGAIANDGDGKVILGSVSFSANTASNKGGGFANLDSTDGQALSAYNITMAGNSATKGGGIYNAESTYDVISVTNSILSTNTPFNCADDDANSMPTRSGGHNVADDLSCFTALASDSNSPALLEPPGLHGGPISTLMVQRPSAASPAIDTGDDAICANPWVEKKDVRGKERPVDENNDNIKQCDIGAVEADQLKAKFESSPAPNSVLDFGKGPLSSALALNNFFVKNSGDTGTLLKLSNPTLSGPHAADFATPTLPPDLLGGASSVNIPLSCTPSAAGVHTATLTFNTSDSDNKDVSYELQCEGVPQPTAGFASNPAAPGPLSIKTIKGTPRNATLQLSETGNANLTLGAPQINSNPANVFSIQGLFPLSINDGAGVQSVAIRCNANIVGLATGTLAFTTNDPANPTLSYNLACDVDKAPEPVLDANAIVAVPDSQAPNTGKGPYGIAMSPDGRHVYVADNGDSKLMLYTRNADNTLTFNEQYLVGATAGLTGTMQVMVSPDGRNVYATGAIGDGMASFRRDADTGALTLMAAAHEGSCIGLGCGAHVSGLNGAYGLAMSPDGKYAYVSAIVSSTVDVFSRITISGSVYGSLSLFGPNFVQQYSHPQLGSAYGIAVSPDGNDLYVAGYSSGSLQALKRNPGTGKLSVSQVLTSAAASGLEGVFRVIASADGKNVYTAAYDSNSVCAFERSQIDGTLSPIQCVKDGVNGVQGLVQASDVALSPDGTHLFATAYGSGGVAVFERNVNTGVILHRQSITATTMAGARGVVVSPEGDAIYVTGNQSNQVVMIPFAHPTPVAMSLLPASIVQSNQPFYLTVNGEDFVANSKVRWNGADLPTEFVNAQQLRALVGDSSAMAVGNQNVTVFNPAPGGGESDPLSFNLVAPPPPPQPGNPPPVPLLTPALAQLSPVGATIGSGPLQINIDGADIAANASVLWNGVSRSLIRDSATHAHFTLSKIDLNVAGINTVQVFNPAGAMVSANSVAAQGATSNLLQFVVNKVSVNPTPSIDSLTPPSAMAGNTQAIQLNINGSNFMATSQVLWNGQTKASQYISKTLIQVTLTADDLALPGAAALSVSNSAPGGGESNLESFYVTPAFAAAAMVANSFEVDNANGVTHLILHGSGFANGDVLMLNHEAHVATVVDANTIQLRLGGVNIVDLSRALTVSAHRPSVSGADSNELVWTPWNVQMPKMMR